MRKLTNEEFVSKSKAIHNNKYDYSRTEYLNNRTKVEIICPVHGSFFQTPHDHLEGKGCKLCGDKAKNIGRTKSIESFISQAKKVHDDKYDYSKVNYINNHTQVEIACPVHGSFYMIPREHINHGYGCPVCGGTQTSNTENFISQAKKVHENRYNYSKVNYVNNQTKVEIICLDHGSFFQKPNKHLFGNGCPKCNISKGELKIKKYLDYHKIKYIYDEACLDFLDKQRPDFYLPDYDMIIEFNGIQHYEPVKCFGGEEEFENIKKRDARKELLCEQNGVKVLKISYKQFDKIEEILNEHLEKGI